MKTYTAKIKGLSSLLQHAFEAGGALDAKGQSRTIALQDELPRDQAARFVYRTGKNGVFVPGAAIARLLREAGASHKMKGSRKSVKWIVPAGCIVTDDELILCDAKGKACKDDDFEVDSRPVVIPATKGRIMRHRPRFDNWSLMVTMEIDTEVIPSELIHQLLEEGGRRLGLGDFRPEKGGSFGRFAIVSWNEVK